MAENHYTSVPNTNKKRNELLIQHARKNTFNFENSFKKSFLFLTGPREKCEIKHFNYVLFNKENKISIREVYLCA